METSAEEMRAATLLGHPHWTEEESEQPVTEAEMNQQSGLS